MQTCMHGERAKPCFDYQVIDPCKFKYCYTRGNDQLNIGPACIYIIKCRTILGAEDVFVLSDTLKING